MPLLVDTGVLYALADRRDAWHRRVVDYLKESPQLLLAPVTILPEVAYLLRERIGERAERAFASSVARGEIAVEGLSAADLKRLPALMERYPSLGLVDASVAAMAERLRLRTLATTDRRHFSELRLSHVDHLALVP
jgi:predicted nucleic acid-binding protein